MNEERFYIPSGMPPGHDPMGQQDAPPEGVYYYRIYAILMAVLFGIVCVSGMAMAISPLFSPGSMSGSGGGAATSLMVGGLFYTAFGAAFFIPYLLSLFAGRRYWVHTLATVLIALSMMSLCCLPVAIPLLIVWLKPETKRWYGS